ncbi:DUF5018 domain-containing protein [Bacteroides thetaiotaomicron]|uniref:DUF5018 domain-containing protein n=1 Tax=Bacteroides thetaiotaomicron TaxID=818 RepID=UPI002164F834|nr:DUF5018 domain-containing protein [Bacteroides thetaiotaomicron]MCS2453173.1 DUF5018 domain-containing protein [Bacteroides thetaiotaomicron]
MNISFAGSLTNFYTTSDKDGNILFTNLTQMLDQPLPYGKPQGVDQAPEKSHGNLLLHWLWVENCQYLAA